MEECRIKFPGPVSKKTVTYLVVDYIKYILYYRGQFPLPFEQLKRVQESEANLRISRRPDVNGHFIYTDTSDILHRRNAIRIPPLDRERQKFHDTVLKFHAFFNELTTILDTKKVLEVILYLGANMITPKELYHIKLPLLCSSEECCIDYTSLQNCKMHLFQSILRSDIWAGLKTDNILPISVLLLLEKDVALDERMELKHFYSLPRNCKPRTICFTDKCSHIDETSMELQNFESLAVSSDIVYRRNQGHWVKLKPELKGFKTY